ncbi:MAG TPA: RNA polymerase sigma-70 factor [Bacteroidales bacterium]|nr:RNA polymerase sigma-70 factor [Bacteroidales bacterium]
MQNTENNSIRTLNEDIFEKLFREHFKGLCFLAQRYVKDLETAREIVQDVFVAFWEKRSVIDLSKSPKSYLATSVSNKCLNYLRDNRKFNKDLLITENLFGEMPAESTDFLVVEEITKKIESAIAELPEKCREIFVMNRFEQLKYHEIAEKLQLSVKTVESQMSKALQHMRLRLADYITLVLLILYFMKNN